MTRKCTHRKTGTALEGSRNLAATFLERALLEICWNCPGTFLKPGSLLEPHCNHVGTAGIEGRSGRERQCIEFDFGGVGFAACVSALVTVPSCAFEPVVLLSPKTSFRVSLFYFCSVVCLISMITVYIPSLNVLRCYGNWGVKMKIV